MSARPPTNSTEQSEERRGIFVLGLIATIATVRYAIGSSYSVPLGNTSVDIVPLLNVILLTWGLYAFLVVLGLTIRRWSDVVFGYARILLNLGLVLTLAVTYGYFLIGFWPYSIYFSGLLLAYALLGLPKYLTYIFMRPKRVNLKSVTTEGVAGAVFGISLILVVISALTKLATEEFAQGVTAVGIASVAVIGLARLHRFISGRHHKSP